MLGVAERFRPSRGQAHPFQPRRTGAGETAGLPVQCELMGVVISPAPLSRNGSDVHNLWGSGSAQPGWALLAHNWTDVGEGKSFRRRPAQSCCPGLALQPCVGM